jgi:hypothetical protein
MNFIPFNYLLLFKIYLSFIIIQNISVILLLFKIYLSFIIIQNISVILLLFKIYLSFLIFDSLLLLLRLYYNHQNSYQIPNYNHSFICHLFTLWLLEEEILS